MKKILLLTLLFCASFPAFSSEALGSGSISNLSYRGGFVMFKVVGANGVNKCEQCPVDPGKMGVGRCWVNENEKSQVSMLLTAKVTNKEIRGRVYSFSTNCTLYQMTLSD